MTAKTIVGITVVALVIVAIVILQMNSKKEK